MGRGSGLKIAPFARYQLPLILWLLVIFALSAIPTLPVVKFPISPDKIVHAGIYFVLCMLSRRAFYYQSRWTWLRDHSLLAAMVFAVLYGILDEVHQLYVPGRWADVYDALADAVGAASFVSWSLWTTRKRTA